MLSMQTACRSYNIQAWEQCTISKHNMYDREVPFHSPCNARMYLNRREQLYWLLSPVQPSDLKSSALLAGPGSEECCDALKKRCVYDDSGKA